MRAAAGRAKASETRHKNAATKAAGAPAAVKGKKKAVKGARVLEATSTSKKKKKKKKNELVESDDSNEKSLPGEEDAFSEDEETLDSMLRWRCAVLKGPKGSKAAMQICLEQLLPQTEKILTFW